MNIGINLLFKAWGGQIPHIVNTLKYLNEKRNDNNINNITLFVTKRNLELFKKNELDGIQIVVSKISNLSTPIRVIWEQIFLPLSIIKRGIDIIYFPGNISLFIKTCKVIQHIATIGPFWDDMYKLDVPINNLKFRLNKFFIIKTSNNADAMLFESEYTKDFFIKKFNTVKENSFVINYGKDANYFPELNEKVLKKYNINTQFALCVSHLYPYKNIINMIKAYHLALADYKFENKFELIIAGKIYYDEFYDEIKKCINKFDLNEIVRTIGIINQKELRALYSQCDFLIFPSPCENFAYTLVEAMSCGAAIVSSNTTAMPETCQNAAVYFDPNDVSDMSIKISDLMNDESVRNDLKLKAINRSKELPDYEVGTEMLLSIMKKLFNSKIT